MRDLVAILLVLMGAGASSCVLPDVAGLASGEAIAPAPAAARDMALAALRASQLQAQQVDVRLWVDGRQEVFRQGDPLRLRFRTSHDAYVAILHIDPDGELEFLFPYGPGDDNYVRGLRTYSLPDDGWNSYWTVNSRSGIGYFYIIASTQPLDFRHFQFGSRWDLSLVGSRVRGDPFWVLAELTRTLVASARYAPHGVDSYSYHVGSRSQYPSFACYDGLGWRERGSWTAYYGSCDRIQLLLRSHPYYYDTRRYNGDRRAYWRDLEVAQPLHGFKEPADLPSRPSGGTPAQPGAPAVGNQLDGRAAPPPLRPRSTTPGSGVERPAREGTEPARPERQRPTLERRSPEQTRERGPERTQERPATPPRAEPRSDPPPRRDAEPRREERRAPERPRESPPPAETAALIVRQPAA